jgi:hypothetical protein
MLRTRAIFVACPYMGMQLSYSSKFRVALSVVPAVVNHVTDRKIRQIRDVNTLIYARFCSRISSRKRKENIDFSPKMYVI